MKKRHRKNLNDRTAVICYPDRKKRQISIQFKKVKPVCNDHLMGYVSAFSSSSKGHLDELLKAEFVSKSKLVPSVFIKTHDWINHR